jgi:pSer/pThr/pTyr-binding forkhead associated (FHA) protein
MKFRVSIAWPLDDPSAEPRAWTFPPVGVTIGRAADCEVCLVDASVAGRHVRLEPSLEGGFTVAALEGDVEIGRDRKLPAGQSAEVEGPEVLVSLGRFGLLAEVVDEHEPQSISNTGEIRRRFLQYLTPTEGEDLRPYVEVLSGPDAGRRHRFPAGGGRLSLGRGPQCDVRFADPEVSVEHAVLVWDGRRVTLTDTGRNGTWADHQRVTAPTEIHHDEEIWLTRRRAAGGEGWDSPNRLVFIDPHRLRDRIRTDLASASGSSAEIPTPAEEPPADRAAPPPTAAGTPLAGEGPDWLVLAVAGVSAAAGLAGLAWWFLMRGR